MSSGMSDMAAGFVVPGNEPPRTGPSHRLLHHGAEQVLFPFVPLIQRP